MDRREFLLGAAALPIVGSVASQANPDLETLDPPAKPEWMQLPPQNGDPLVDFFAEIWTDDANRVLAVGYGVKYDPSMIERYPKTPAT